MAGDKLSAAELAELLDRLAHGLQALYGERYQGLVLYGSYARGEADEGSDVDVLLLLDGDVARIPQGRARRLAPLAGERVHDLAPPGERGGLPGTPQTLSYERSQGGSIDAVSEVGAFLLKAGRSFDAAETLLESVYVDFAASRAYYGCFYVAEALLLDEGLSFSRHGSVIGEYGRLFARTERLDRHFHRLLTRTFAARQTAGSLPIKSW